MTAVNDPMNAPPARKLRARDHFALSSYWLATNVLWGAYLVIVLPSQIKKIAPLHPAETQGVMLGWGTIPALVVPLLVGALSDRCTSRWGRRRPYMVAGVIINLAGLVMAWYAGSVLSLALYFVGYLVIQTGNNIATGSYSGIIPDIVPKENRGEASGWMGAMSQIGTIVGTVSAGVLMGRHQPGLAYLVVGLSMTFFLAVTCFGVKEKPLECPPSRFDLVEFLKSLWVDPRKHPDFAWVWITRALVVMGLWTVQQYLQYYLADEVGVKDPELYAGLVLTLGLVCATATGILGGKISDRVGRKKVVYVANSVIAAATLAFVFVHSLPVVFVLGAIFGLGYGAYFSVDWALGCDVLPNPDDAAKDMGVWHIAMVLPQAIALPIAGIVLGKMGSTVTHDAAGQVVTHYSSAGYTAIFSMAAFYLLLGAVLLRNVKKVR